MKTLLFFAIPLLVLNFGCSNNSGPGTNNSNALASGSAYLPLPDNALWTAHITGTDSEFDASGSLSQTEQTDADYKASLGIAQQRGGRSVFPLFSFEQNGQITNDGNAVGYGFTADSEVLGFNESDANDAATILPKTLSVGLTWTPAPEASPIQCQATLAQHLSSFTNKGGTSYNDVIQVHVTYFDSSSYQYSDTSMAKYSANVDFYFANGTGLVEADVHHFEILKFDRYYGYYSEFQHSIGSGTVYRKN